MKALLTILGFILLTPLILGAREVRLIYYKGPSEAPREAFLYGASGQFVQVRLPRSNASDAYELPDNGENFILLPEELPPTQLPPEVPLPAGAPIVNIPLDWSLTLLLVIEDKSNPIFPVKVQPINASDSVFGPGQTYWINLTDIFVGGTVGDTRMVIKPRSMVITEPPREDRGDYKVVIDSVTPGENKRRWLVRQTWRHSPEARQLVFIHPLEPPRIASLYSISFYD